MKVQQRTQKRLPYVLWIVYWIERRPVIVCPHYGHGHQKISFFFLGFFSRWVAIVPAIEGNLFTIRVYN